jgi:NDP-sugar pyrophosphorylase family protein
MNDLIAGGAVKDWAPRAFREFALHHPLYALSTRGLPWIEIDFPEDYQRAVNEVYPRIQAEPLPEQNTYHLETPSALVFNES